MILVLLAFPIYGSCFSEAGSDSDGNQVSLRSVTATERGWKVGGLEFLNAGSTSTVLMANSVFYSSWGYGPYRGLPRKVDPAL